MSSMSPIIVFSTDGGNDTVAVGGAGGSAIISGVAGVAMQMMLAKKDAKFAVDSPRIHNQLRPNVTQYEDWLPQASVSLGTFYSRFQASALRGRIDRSRPQYGRPYWQHSQHASGRIAQHEHTADLCKFRLQSKKCTLFFVLYRFPSRL